MSRPLPGTYYKGSDVAVAEDAEAAVWLTYIGYKRDPNAPFSSGGATSYGDVSGLVTLSPEINAHEMNATGDITLKPLGTGEIMVRVTGTGAIALDGATWATTPAQAPATIQMIRFYGGWKAYDVAAGGAGGGNGLPSNVLVKSGGYTASVNDFVLGNATGGAFTVLLPATHSAGDLVAVKKMDSSANLITVNGQGGDTIDGDGVGLTTIATKNAGAIFMSDGNNWVIAAILSYGGGGGSSVTIDSDGSLVVDGVTVELATDGQIAGLLSSAAAPELIRDTIASALVQGTNMTITVNDGADTITLAAASSGGGGGGTGAAPNALTGAPTLAAWYKADALTGLANGDPVDTWADSSGNARDLGQATSGKRPLYVAANPLLNGKPSLRFDGVDDCMFKNATGIASGSAYTLFVVTYRQVESSGVGSGGGCVIDCRGTAFLNLATDASVPSGVTIRAGNPTGTTTYPAGVSGAFIYMVTYDGAETIGFEEARARKRTTTLTGAMTLSTINVGANDAAGGGNTPWLGDVAEVGLYTQVLTNAQRLELLRHLTNKYGFAAVA
jgi:hypothetical protein